MIRNYRDTHPRIATSAFIEESACVIGDVVIGEKSSVWFNVVVRGDVNYIRIGDRTNLQDGTVVHVSRDTHPTVLGDDVTVAHSVTLHGCTIGNGCLVGIGATVLDGAEIGEGSMIAAGTLVVPGTKVPPRSLIIGNPGKVKRQLSDEEVDGIMDLANRYVAYREDYLADK